MSPARARPLPFSAEFRRIFALAICPQMMPGIQPMHVMIEASEHTRDAMARAEVFCAVAGGEEVVPGAAAGTDGTTTSFRQCGQLILAPMRAALQEISWLQA